MSLFKKKEITEPEDITEGVLSLRVEVSTNECDEGEAYFHDFPYDAERPIQLSIVVDAIETIYGHQGVTSIYIHLVEV